MILGIGTDLAKIDRIAQTLDKQGQRFVDRCFTQTEQERAQNYETGSQAWQAHFAKRWAAKEACAKALGLGIDHGIYLKDIGIVNDEHNAPQIELTAGAKKRLTEITPQGMVADIHISLSDDPPDVLAFVIISARPV